MSRRRKEEGEDDREGEKGNESIERSPSVFTQHYCCYEKRGTFFFL